MNIWLGAAAGFTCAMGIMLAISLPTITDELKAIRKLLEVAKSGDAK